VSDGSRVRDFVAELTAEQIHTENAATIAHRYSLYTQDYSVYYVQLPNKNF